MHSASKVVKREAEEAPGLLRIAVVGRAGAGKTTAARALATAFELPLVHLDRFAWDPAWQPVERGALDRRHAEAVAARTWVLDGGYCSRAGWAARLRRADVVVLVEAPLPVCLWRIARRGLIRSGVRRDDLPEGCTDCLSASFVFWTITWAGRSRTPLAPLERGDPGMPPMVRVSRGEDPVEAVRRVLENRG